MKRTMLKPAAACALAAALAAGFSTAANAANANIPGLGGPTAIAVGAYWPNSDDAKNAGGSTQIQGDIRYHLPVRNTSITVPASTLLEAGVQAGTNHGNHSTIIPVTIGEEIGLDNKSPMAVNNGYVGAGIGAYFMNQSGLSTAARLGGYVDAGYNFTPSVFGEAKYQFVNHGDGPLLSVGFRF